MKAIDVALLIIADDALMDIMRMLYDAAGEKPSWHGGYACAGIGTSNLDACALGNAIKYGLAHRERTGGCYITRRGWLIMSAIETMRSADLILAMANKRLREADALDSADGGQHNDRAGRGVSSSG